MSRLSLSLLGPKQILLDGNPAGPFTYSKAIALLAYLAVEADFPHSRQALVGLLWPDLPNAAALTNLRQVLADLRRVLADETAPSPFLLITRVSIQFNANSDFQLDTRMVLHTLAACESHRHIDRCRTCQARLEDATALYRGDFLGGFSVDEAVPFEEWVALRREEFHLQVQQLLVHLVNYQLRCRNDENAQRYLRRQVELEPWNEEAHRQLMRLYAGNSQRSNALLQFENCQRILQSELGVEPSPLTQTLYAQIRAGLPLVEEINTQPHSRIGGEIPVAPASAAARYWQNLPLMATSLVSRAKELEQLGELLQDPAYRLITILGPGGMGKTRLAIAAAAENAAAFGNGVLYVALAGMSDVHFLPNAIMSALDASLPDRQAPQAQLLSFLRDLELLLLLDNYEQFLPDVTFLTQLLRSAPGVTILVTSRERLAMQAEHLFELAGLDHPRAVAVGATNATLDEYSALQLFLQRVRQVRRHSIWSMADLAAILRIGRITEGMPLALELAAAAVRSHSCADIANALESGQQVLATEMRDLPERQRSMQAVFAHSMRLLSAQEYESFCALALFRGGFSAEAGQEVAYTSPQMLAVLVDKSLLRTNDTYRYDMHELMRQFAERELAASGVLAQVRQRYAAYFVAMAKAASVGLAGAQTGNWIARLEPEIDNLRAVLRWLRQEAPVDALRMAMDLFWLWHSRSFLQEGLHWLLDLSGLNAPVAPYLQADVYRAASFFALCLNNVEQAHTLIMRSLALFEALDMTDRQNAEGYVFALTRLSFVLLFQGKFEQALGISGRALTMAKELDSKFYISLALMQEMGDLRSIGQRLGRLANVAAAQGDLEEARLFCQQALTTCNQCRDHVGLSMALLVAVRLANLEGDYPRAALLLGATDTILDANPIVRTWPQDRRSYRTSIEALHAQLDAGDFELQWAKGRALSIEQVIALAVVNQAEATVGS